VYLSFFHTTQAYGDNHGILSAQLFLVLHTVRIGSGCQLLSAEDQHFEKL